MQSDRLMDVFEALSCRRRLVNDMLGGRPPGSDPYTEGLRDGLEEALILLGRLIGAAIAPEGAAR